MSPAEKHQTILVAEDETMLRMAVVELLQDAGYDVIDAADGDQGYSILQSEKPVDLLVSDVKMPGMNGYQLAEAGLALRPELRVLLMTGYAQDPLPSSIRKAGARLMHKPFDFDELVGVVEGLLADGA